MRQDIFPYGLAACFSMSEFYTLVLRTTNSLRLQCLSGYDNLTPAVGPNSVNPSDWALKPSFGEWSPVVNVVRAHERSTSVWRGIPS